MCYASDEDEPVVYGIQHALEDVSSKNQTKLHSDNHISAKDHYGQEFLIENHPTFNVK